MKGPKFSRVLGWYKHTSVQRGQTQWFCDCAHLVSSLRAEQIRHAAGAASANSSGKNTKAQLVSKLSIKVGVTIHSTPKRSWPWPACEPFQEGWSSMVNMAGLDQFEVKNYKSKLKKRRRKANLKAWAS